MSEHSDQLDVFGKPLNEHIFTFNTYLGTVRCKCGLWACFRTSPRACSEAFQAHVAKETQTPTDAGTKSRALQPPLFKRRLPC